VTAGQCDGTADAPYPGFGRNKHCAFSDVRFLWQDGTYATGTSFPAYGWIGQGGDTYLIRGSIGTGISYRVGWNNSMAADDKASGHSWGVAGDPYGSGPPPLPSGTADRHTRLLGENYAECHAASAKTQLHGGYGLFYVLNMTGVSYVDVACLDITDFSSCGRSGQVNACTTSMPLSDYATNGIGWSNTSTHDTLTDVHIHGLAGAGMLGPTGDGMVFDYLDLVGNAGSGWNADSGNGQTGTGSLLVKHYNISWNGCVEEYPLADAQPFTDCTDDNRAGYGDGFGTASVASNPGWNVTFDQGTVFYNTQDGLDALHIVGEGSSMTVNQTLAYGNMGQQIKIGGANGVVTNNQIVTNCNALREAIPGTPAGFNKNLSDFCRAADTGIAVTVNDLVPLRFDSNIIYSANVTGIEIECAYASCASPLIDFRNNIFIGFPNTKATGYPDGGRGGYSNPIYLGPGFGINPFRNKGSLYSNNTTYHASSSWRCPASGETQAHCGDPQLVDESWHRYGYGNMAPAAGALHNPTSDSPETAPGASRKRRVATQTIGCVCVGVLAAVSWQRLRQTRSR
jgi:hypothetical protein